jgi:Leucine-rich repeat (LRR) protein
MVDDAPAGDLVIDQAFANKLNENDGRVLSLSRLRSSPDVIEKLRDEHLIDIIDTYFKADEMISIDFSDCVGITDAALKYISTKCTRLERLRVGGCEKITDDGIKAIVEKIGKKLKILSYSNCNRCTDSALQAIVQNCPNLSTLAAENAGITQIPEAIGKNLPQELGDLYLENNDIKTISPAVLSSILALLRKGGLLMISGNPLQDVPTEVLEGGNSAILKHLKTLPIQKEGLTHEHPVGGIDDSPNFDLTHEQNTFDY